MVHPDVDQDSTGGRKGGAHILVVNDTEEILDLFRTILEELGHRVTAWSFSPDDLSKVTDVGPDLVILDLIMGPTELQGWALLQKMRMHRPTEDIPVIVCSAATNWVREQEGWLAANGVKVVLKPFKVTDLERAVGDVLALSEMTTVSRAAETEGELPQQRQAG
jgi:CheY-like chemotaxis protein